MMLNEYFIKQGIKESQIEEFIRKKFPVGDYSKTEIQRTPLGIKIIIYTNKPGRIIGKSGKNINEMTEAVKEKFGLDNPQLDVKMIRNPNLDPRIVAKQIASALEKGYNFKKIGNLTIKRIMDSGAIGAQIIISGKLGGGKGMTGKFQEGYLKHCGEPVRTLVDYGFEEAQTRPGKIGIKVKIMKQFQDITGEIRDSVQHRIDITKEEPEKESEEGKPREKHPKKEHAGDKPSKETPAKEKPAKTRPLREDSVKDRPAGDHAKKEPAKKPETKSDKDKTGDKPPKEGHAGDRPAKTTEKAKTPEKDKQTGK